MIYNIQINLFNQIIDFNPKTVHILFYRNIICKIFVALSAASVSSVGDSLPEASCGEEDLKRSHLDLVLKLFVLICRSQIYLITRVGIYFYAKQGLLSVCIRQVFLCIKISLLAANVGF